MVKMEKRKSLVFFLEWMKVIRKYDRLFQWLVVTVICDYQESREVPNFKSYFKEKEVEKLGDAFFEKAETAFAFIKADIDRNNEKFDKLCERRREWGKKGGAPKGNQNARKNNLKVDILPQGKKSTKSNYNENENENENENVGIINYSLIYNIFNQSINQRRIKNFLVVFEKENREVAPKEFLTEFLKEGGAADFIEEMGGQEKFGEIFIDVLEDWSRKGAGVHKNSLDAFDHLMDHARIKNNYRKKKEKQYGKGKQRREKSDSDKAEHAESEALGGGYSTSESELSF